MNGLSWSFGRRGLPGAATASMAAALVALAGCAAGHHAAASGGSGSGQAGGHGQGSGHGSKPGGSLSAAQAVALASKQARRITSLTMTESVTMHGVPASAGLPAGGSVRMLVHEKMQLKPKLLAALTMSMNLAGRQLTLDEILTSGALYLKAPGVVPSQAGKPWAKVSLSALPNGMNLRKLFAQTRSGPLGQLGSPDALVKLLARGKHVHVVQDQVVDGVSTTEYSGDLTLANISALMPPSERKLLGSVPAGLRLAGPFRVWIDGQHHTRRVQLRIKFAAMTMTVLANVTSVNGPVTITPPPPSQVAPISGQ